MLRGKGTIFLALLIASSLQLSLKLDANNRIICFYIRGETVDSEFVLNYGWSGEGYTNVRTRV